MKSLFSFFLFLSIFVLISCSETDSNEIDYYQLKVYSIDSLDQLEMLNQYLEYAYLPALHRAGIENVGVFRTIEGRNNNQNLLVVFIPYYSLAQFEEIPLKLQEDVVYLEAGAQYINAAHDQAPYIRIKSTLLRAFSETPLLHIPEMESKKAERVYELRSYQSATEKLHQRKVEMFNSGESQLFIDLGFQPMFYGEVLSGAVMPNLVYMTCHTDSDAQSKNWKEFVDHPTWNKMKVMEKYQNTVSHIDKWMLYPLEYSDL